MNAQSYLRWFFGLLLSGVLLVGTVNAVVDPYGTFDLVSLADLNVEKPERLAGGGRTERSVDLRRGRYDTLILGSSRAQIGLDPMSTILEGELSYNAALAGTNFYELHKVGLFALAHQDLKRVIIGLDFLLFSTRRTVRGDFADSGFAGRSLGSIYLRQLISADTLSDSIVTVLANRFGRRSANRLDGYIDGTLRFGRTEPRRLFTGVLESNFLVDPETYASYDYGLDRVELFRDLVERFARRGVAVHVFISPVHARQLEALRLLGLFPIFERWKRDVVASVEEVNKGLARPQKSVAIWDFSGYNSITTETVPAAGAGKATKWFWESSHYKKQVGDLVLLRMLRPEIPATVVPRDFGVRLSSDMIDSHMELVRREAQRYRNENPVEVADVERLYRKTEPIRRALN